MFSRLRSQARELSRVVSAALATVRSSGSSLGVLLVLRSICTLTDEPFGGAAVTEEKSGANPTQKATEDYISERFG